MSSYLSGLVSAQQSEQELNNFLSTSKSLFQEELFDAQSIGDLLATFPAQAPALLRHSTIREILNTVVTHRNHLKNLVAALQPMLRSSKDPQEFIHLLAALKEQFRFISTPKDIYFFVEEENLNEHLVLLLLAPKAPEVLACLPLADACRFMHQLMGYLIEISNTGVTVRGASPMFIPVLIERIYEWALALSPTLFVTQKDMEAVCQEIDEIKQHIENNLFSSNERIHQAFKPFLDTLVIRERERKQWQDFCEACFPASVSPSLQPVYCSVLNVFIAALKPGDNETGDNRKLIAALQEVVGKDNDRAQQLLSSLQDVQTLSVLGLAQRLGFFFSRNLPFTEELEASEKRQQWLKYFTALHQKGLNTRFVVKWINELNGLGAEQSTASFAELFNDDNSPWVLQLLESALSDRGVETLFRQSALCPESGLNQFSWLCCYVVQRLFNSVLSQDQINTLLVSTPLWKEIFSRLMSSPVNITTFVEVILESHSASQNKSTLPAFLASAALKQRILDLSSDNQAQLFDDLTKLASKMTASQARAMQEVVGYCIEGLQHPISEQRTMLQKLLMLKNPELLKQFGPDLFEKTQASIDSVAFFFSDPTYRCAAVWAVWPGIDQTLVRLMALPGAGRLVGGIFKADGANVGGKALYSYASIRVGLVAIIKQPAELMQLLIPVGELPGFQEMLDLLGQLMIIVEKGKDLQVWPEKLTEKIRASIGREREASYVIGSEQDPSTLAVLGKVLARRSTHNKWPNQQDPLRGRIFYLLLNAGYRLDFFDKFFKTQAGRALLSEATAMSAGSEASRVGFENTPFRRYLAQSVTAGAEQAESIAPL